MNSNRVLPKPTPLTQPYFDGCGEGRLLLQQCDDCHGWQFYPRLVCSHCGAKSLSWRQSPGIGRVASFTVVRRAVSSAYTAPYVIALVDLDEGVRMMTQLRDIDPDQAAVGQRVEVLFEPWGDDWTMPVFRVCADLKDGG